MCVVLAPCHPSWCCDSLGVLGSPPGAGPKCWGSGWVPPVIPNGAGGGMGAPCNSPSLSLGFSWSCSVGVDGRKAPEFRIN